MSYPIGTRVRKVRGNINIGSTGVVVECPPQYTDWKSQLMLHIQNLDMWVRADNTFVNGLDPNVLIPAGTASVTRKSEWEPILLDGLEPAEDDFELPLPQEEHALG